MKKNKSKITRQDLVYAFIIWKAYNHAEKRMAEEMHEPFMSMQETLVALVLGLSLKAYDSAEKKSTEYGTEMMRYEKEIRKTLKEEFQKLGKIEDRLSKDIVSDAVLRATKEMDKVLGSVTEGFDIDLKRLSSNIWDKNSKQFQEAMKKVSMHIREGHSVQSLTLEIQKMTGSNEYRAYRLARTETMKYLNENLLEIYKRAGVRYVKEIVVQDERTSQECSEHVGLVWKIEDAPILPRRWNCRCTLSAIPQSENDKFDKWDF